MMVAQQQSAQPTVVTVVQPPGGAGVVCEPPPPGQAQVCACGLLGDSNSNSSYSFIRKTKHYYRQCIMSVSYVLKVFIWWEEINSCIFAPTWGIVSWPFKK